MCPHTAGSAAEDASVAASVRKESRWAATRGHPPLPLWHETSSDALCHLAGLRCLSSLSDAPSRRRSIVRSAVLIARILVMSETMSLADVKARFSEVVDRVERQQDRVVVTRNGKPAAVLISPDDLESLEETLAVMSDRSVAAQIRESQRSAAAGDLGTDLDELRTDLEKRRGPSR